VPEKRAGKRWEGALKCAEGMGHMAAAECDHSAKIHTWTSEGSSISIRRQIPGWYPEMDYISNPLTPAYSRSCLTHITCRVPHGYSTGRAG
jgi:hypothetical protein